MLDRTACLRLGPVVGVGFVVCLLGLPITQTNAADLKADELLLLYNAADQSSRELAEYYATVRNVPPDRLLGLSLKEPGEQITPQDYDHDIRDPARAYLEKTALRDRIRCLVCFYGLPIRVGAQSITPDRAKLLERWRVEVQANLDEFREVIGALGPEGTRPAKPEAKPPEFQVQYLQLQQDYLRAAQAVLERLKQTPGADTELLSRKLLEALQKVQGLRGVLAQTGFQPAAPGVTAEQLRSSLEQDVKQKQERVMAIMAKGVDDPSRDEARRLLREIGGINSVLESYQADINFLRVDETVAAVDSELSLLWWGDYPKYRWVVNPDAWRARAKLAGQHPAVSSNRPVLMVSRIDGPTPAIARGLIDKAVAAEKSGVSGTVYIDARGIQGMESYGEYDTYLRQWADILRKKTSLKVQLDNKPTLFQPGKCPQTMLYCGWYSLRKYVDAFAFVPGAVGYHLASLEAVSLKRPGEEGWCARMLSKGITATLGAVDEPYLLAFPRPDDFFGLLLTGRFTLAEVWGYTVPLHSWRMMLIGDPLYRPFGTHPVMKLEQAVPSEIIPPEFRATTAPAKP